MSITDRSYFYKADSFPEVVVNESGTIKPLAESCQIRLPENNLVLPVPDYCKHCGNHPSNGGSGLCFCTLGTPEIR